MTTAGADPESKNSSLKDKAKAAAKAAALTAEKTKLTTVSLPIAYTALAQDCYKAKRWEKDFPDQFSELNKLAAQIAESKRKSEEESPAGESVMDKAKSLASKGTEAAKVQKLKLSTKVALAKFGEAVFEKHGAESGPAELVKEIETLHARLAEVEVELGEQVGKAGGASWLKKAAVVVAVVLVIGAFMGRSGSVCEKCGGRGEEYQKDADFQQYKCETCGLWVNATEEAKKWKTSHTSLSNGLTVDECKEIARAAAQELAVGDEFGKVLLVMGQMINCRLNLKIIESDVFEQTYGNVFDPRTYVRIRYLEGYGRPGLKPKWIQDLEVVVDGKRVR